MFVIIQNTHFNFTYYEEGKNGMHSGPSELELLNNTLNELLVFPELSVSVVAQFTS